MLTAIADTAVGEVTVYVGLDHGDPTREAYPPEGIDYVGDVIVRVADGPPAQLAEWTNRLAWRAIMAGHEILASFGDDHRPRTRGWDRLVTEAMRRMGPGLVYTADGLQDERLPTAPFWHAGLVARLGWFFPPAQKHLYADDFWLRFANDLHRRTYLPDVLIEHLHPSAPNGNQADAVNAANDSYYAADRQAFEELVSSPAYGQALERARAVL